MLSFFFALSLHPSKSVRQWHRPINIQRIFFYLEQKLAISCKFLFLLSLKTLRLCQQRQHDVQDVEY